MDTIMMRVRRGVMVLAVVAPGIAAADNPPPAPPPPQQPQPQQPAPQPQPPSQQQPYPGQPPYQGQPPAPYPGQAPAPYPGQAPAPYPGQAPAPYPAPYPYPYPYQQPQRPAPIGPAEITDFDETQPVRPGYTLVKRKHKGLLIGGGITLGVSYMIAVLVAASDDDSHRNDPTVPTHDGLWVPVLGPFLELGSSSSSSTSTSGSTNSTVGYLELGVAESAGAVLLAIGLTREKKVLVRNDQLTMSVMPMVGHGASGVMAFGRF